MEQREIDELQAYINQFFNNKKIITMPQDTFYVAEHEDAPLYVSGLDSNNEAVFSQSLNNAEWSESEEVVQGFINRYNIQNVKPKPKGGVRPNKPPLVP